MHVQVGDAHRRAGGPREAPDYVQGLQRFVGSPDGPAEGAAREVPEPHEGEARRAPRRGDGRKRARLLERPTRGSPARADLPDARATRTPKTAATSLIGLAWIVRVADLETSGATATHLEK